MKHKSRAKREARKRNTFEAQQAHATRVLKRIQARIPDATAQAPAERPWDIEAVVVITDRRRCTACMKTYDVPNAAPMLRVTRPNNVHPGAARESRMKRIEKDRTKFFLEAGYAIEHRTTNSIVKCCASCTPERPAQVNGSPGVPRQLLGDELLSGEEATPPPAPKANVPSLEDF